MDEIMIWKEKVLVPKMDTVHIKDRYDNPCKACEEWGEQCEFCNVSVPLVSEYEYEEITMKQMVICGIPVGCAYMVEE